MDAAGRYAERLIHRLQGVLDRNVQLAYVHNELANMPFDSVLRLLALSLERVEANDVPYRNLLWLFCATVADASFADTRRQLCTLATETGQRLLADLLADSPASQKNPEHAAARQKSGRPLTLGERKALARRRDRALIRRALQDANPNVIRILLGNPALTEEDVVQLCARRPLAPKVFRELLRCPRWITRSRVQRTIAKNPSAPLDVSLSVSAQLPAQDAAVIAESPDLPLELREACLRRLHHSRIEQ